jgi:hypothetical protein
MQAPPDCSRWYDGPARGRDVTRGWALTADDVIPLDSWRRSGLQRP